MIDTESYSYKKLGGREEESSISKRSSILFANTLGVSLLIIFASLVQCSLGTRGLYGKCMLGEQRQCNVKFSSLLPRSLSDQNTDTYTNTKAVSCCD